MGDVQARSFSGTLFLGGANCVLESAHEIDVEVALRLSKALHQTLVQGGTPADAVRSFFGGLQDEERFDDLFYHSLIRVVGAGQVPVFSDSLGE